MCGIAALVGTAKTTADAAWAMLETIRHRGPDGAGVAVLGPCGTYVADRRNGDARGDIALGHARLAILDLSEAGAQPMSSEAGDVWVTFNGEIFNFAELRRELEGRGHEFRSRTDTEVLVHGWEEWGLKLVERIHGMFAFVLHDTRSGETVLARDRLGIKPLYYADLPGGGLAVASEIKALLAAGVEARLDPIALDSYLTWLWVPDPDTVFAGVKKLEPGHVLVVSRDGRRVLRSYWAFEYEPNSRATREGAGWLRDAVEQAVARQLVSDVPLGAFFSGGVDSTAIVEVMRRRLAPEAPTCFTVGFSRRDLAHDVVGDDLRYARLYAARTRIDYREAILEPDLATALPQVVWHMDEPVADPAALSAFHISRAARAQGLTVLLSGMGGDELLGGYPRYRAAALARRFRLLPRPLRRLVRSFAFALPGAGPHPLARLGRNAQKLLRSAELAFPEDYLGFLTFLDVAERRALYADDLRAAVGAADSLAVHRAHLSAVSAEPWLHQAMYLDLKTYLPAHNLTYVDRMSMAHSIEVRVPLLDELVVDVARRLPPESKLRGSEAKALFRAAVRGLVPDEIRDRPKAGFSAPVRGWLVHELRPLVDDLLSPAAVRHRGLFRPSAVARLVDDLRSGRRDTALQIWQLLTLELWHRRFLEAR